MAVGDSTYTGRSILLSPQMFSDPYPLYDILRAHGPVVNEPLLGAWMALGYDEASAALRDPRFKADRIPTDEHLDSWNMAQVKPVFNISRKMMLFQDPPDHTRLRGLVNKAFTPRVVEAMRQQVQTLVDELLAPGIAAGGLDVIADLAVPLPTVVIAIMLGVPREDRDLLKKWSDDFGLFIGKFDISPEEYVILQESLVAFSEYFRERLAEVRKAPRNDLLSALAQAELAGDKLSEEELLANCILLLAAGHETTTNLIGNGTLALLRNPEQKELLQANPSLITSAVEELLRYDSPVQLTGRIAGEDIDLGGVTVPAGHELLVCLGAANRDPKRFVEPNRLDITRADNRHLSFSLGPHFCLGAPLARLEGQIAIGTLFTQLPDMRLATDDLQWQHNQVLHGLKSLPVSA